MYTHTQSPKYLPSAYRVKVIMEATGSREESDQTELRGQRSITVLRKFVGPDFEGRAIRWGWRGDDSKKLKRLN